MRRRFYSVNSGFEYLLNKIHVQSVKGLIESWQLDDLASYLYLELG